MHPVFTLSICRDFSGEKGNKHVIKCVKGELISQLHYRLRLKTVRHAQHQLVRHMQYQNVIIKQVAAQNGKLQCHGSDVIVVI